MRTPAEFAAPTVDRRRFARRAAGAVFAALLFGVAAPPAVACQAQRAAYCDVGTAGTRVEIVRPAAGEEPIDDVNWFARPVPNAAGDRIIGFASHDQNYLYNLTDGRKIRIPDRSDAVATPDGRYMTVPGTYTPDGSVRFYDLAELLAHLERGEDADDLEPVLIDDRPGLKSVYYQSVGIVAASETETIYRMIFSGTNEPAGFRVVDYTFREAGGDVDVLRGTPLQVCPQITNDLNTPFISKDGRHIAAYTSSSAARRYTDGSSLRIFEIVGVDAEAGTLQCEQRVDFGFAAGKADFSFDGTKLTFHVAKSQYLVPFINGGLRTPAITDVVVVELLRDRSGRIVGHGELARVTTSEVEGVGSYFPAFFPDGSLFYIYNSVPADSDDPKRFSFKVVDPTAELYSANFFDDFGNLALGRAIGTMWQQVCRPDWAPLLDHESPWYFLSLGAEQCAALVSDAWKGPQSELDLLLRACNTRLSPLSKN